MSPTPGEEIVSTINRPILFTTNYKANAKMSFLTVVQVRRRSPAFTKTSSVHVNNVGNKLMEGTPTEITRLKGNDGSSLLACLLFLFLYAKATTCGAIFHFSSEQGVVKCESEHTERKF